MINLFQWKKNKLNGEFDEETQSVTLTPKPAYDKQNETDRQMLLRIARKFAWIIFVILMFDTLLDWFLGIIDLLIELLHLVIEFFEYSLEVLVEHVLHSNHHESETIIVNAVLLVGLYGFYRFLKVLPVLASRLYRRFNVAWVERKREEACHWQALSLERKVKIVAVYSGGIFCVLFLLTL